MSESPIREKIKDAVIALGGKARARDVIPWLKNKYGDINEKTIRAQIVACTVNRESRIHFPENKKSRESDPRYDLFYSTGKGEIEIFDSSKHGNWGIKERNGKYKITHEGKVVSESDAEFFFIEKDFESLKPEKESSQYLHTRFKELQTAIKNKLSESFNNLEKAYVNNPFNQGTKKFRDYHWLGLVRKDTFVGEKTDALQFQVSLTKEEDLSVMLWLDGLAKNTREIVLDQIKNNEDLFLEKLRNIPSYYIGIQDDGGENENDTIVEQITSDFVAKIIERLAKRKTELYIVKYISKEEAIRSGEEIAEKISNIFEELVPISDFLGKTELSRTNSDCFIFRSNENSPYKDLEGIQYQYNSHVPKANLVKKNDSFILQTKIDGEYYFLGYGQIASITESQTTDSRGRDLKEFVARYKNYKAFEENKPRTEEIFSDIQREAEGFNNQHSIWKIPESLFNSIVGGIGMSQSTSGGIDPNLELLEEKKQVIFYGPPGTGKTRAAGQLAEAFVANNTLSSRNFENIRINKEPQSPDVRSFSDDEYNQYVIKKIEEEGKKRGFTLTKEKDSEHLYTLKDQNNEIRIGVNFSGSSKINAEDVYLGVPTKMVEFLSGVPEHSRYQLIVNNSVKNFIILPYQIKMKYARFVSSEELGKWEPTGVEQHAFHITITEDGAELPKRENSGETLDCNRFVRNIKMLFGDFIRNVTFHLSYSYEEFIEGIRPKLNSNSLSYEMENGIFKTISNDARNDKPENKYVLFIDEINRGNISKIFGELITLIENDKRETLYSTLTYTKESFTVPKNLYIIGTMNTADKSLTLLDVALRRRFGFIELMPENALLNQDVDVDGSKFNLSSILENLNTKIRKKIGRERQIGHSYFMKDGVAITTDRQLQSAFVNEIVPLLQEYLYEDYSELFDILGEGFVNKDDEELETKWKKDLKDFKAALNSIP